MNAGVSEPMGQQVERIPLEGVNRGLSGHITPYSDLLPANLYLMTEKCRSDKI